MKNNRLFDSEKYDNLPLERLKQLRDLLKEDVKNTREHVIEPFIDNLRNYNHAKSEIMGNINIVNNHDFSHEIEVQCILYFIHKVEDGRKKVIFYTKEFMIRNENDKDEFLVFANEKLEDFQNQIDLGMEADKLFAEGIEKQFNEVDEAYRIKLANILANQLSDGDKENQLERENQLLNNQLNVATEKIKALTKKGRMKEISPILLQQIADKTRKRNGKLNYLKIGKELGISYKTAQVRCKEFKIN